MKFVTVPFVLLSFLYFTTCETAVSKFKALGTASPSDIKDFVENTCKAGSCFQELAEEFCPDEHSKCSDTNFADILVNKILKCSALSNDAVLSWYETIGSYGEDADPHFHGLRTALNTAAVSQSVVIRVDKSEAPHVAIFYRSTCVCSSDSEFSMDIFFRSNFDAADASHPEKSWNDLLTSASLIFIDGSLGPRLYRQDQLPEFMTEVDNMLSTLQYSERSKGRSETLEKRKRMMEYLFALLNWESLKSIELPRLGKLFMVASNYLQLIISTRTDTRQEELDVYLTSDINFERPKFIFMRQPKYGNVESKINLSKALSWNDFETLEKKYGVVSSLCIYQSSYTLVSSLIAKSNHKCPTPEYSREDFLYQFFQLPTDLTIGSGAITFLLSDKGMNGANWVKESRRDPTQVLNALHGRVFDNIISVSDIRRIDTMFERAPKCEVRIKSSGEISIATVSASYEPTQLSGSNLDKIWRECEWVTDPCKPGAKKYWYEGKFDAKKLDKALQLISKSTQEEAKKKLATTINAESLTGPDLSSYAVLCVLEQSDAKLDFKDDKVIISSDGTFPNIDLTKLPNINQGIGGRPFIPGSTSGPGSSLLDGVVIHSIKTDKFWDLYEAVKNSSTLQGIKSRIDDAHKRMPALKIVEPAVSVLGFGISYATASFLLNKGLITSVGALIGLVIDINGDGILDFKDILVGFFAGVLLSLLNDWIFKSPEFFNCVIILAATAIISKHSRLSSNVYWTGFSIGAIVRLLARNLLSPTKALWIGCIGAGVGYALNAFITKRRGLPPQIHIVPNHHDDGGYDGGQLGGNEDEDRHTKTTTCAVITTAVSGVIQVGTNALIGDNPLHQVIRVVADNAAINTVPVVVDNIVAPIVDQAVDQVRGQVPVHHHVDPIPVHHHVDPIPVHHHVDPIPVRPKRRGVRRSELQWLQRDMGYDQSQYGIDRSGQTWYFKRPVDHYHH